MIRFYCFFSGNLTICKKPKIADERKLVFSVIDFTTIECSAGAILFGLGKKLERIVGSACRAT